MSRVIAIDYETFYSSKLKYSVKSMIAEQYVKHPLFDPYLLAVSDGQNTWVGSPKNFNWSVLNGAVVLAHNSYFEQNVTLEMENREWIPKGTYASVKEWHCTSAMTRYLCNRAALSQAVEHLLGYDMSKEMRDFANNKKWTKDFSPADQKRMIEYARGDTHRCYQLWDKHSDRWPEHERLLSRLSIESGMYGAQIDTALLNDFIVRSHEMRCNTEKLIPWIAGAEDDEEEGDDWDDFMPEKKRKPTSTKCIAEQCRRVGIPCPPVKAEDEEGYEEWEATYSPTEKWIEALGAWRTVNRLYKTYLVIKDRLRPDGTMPFELKYFAAHTGRWGGGSKFNMQNMPRRPSICNEHGLLELNEDKIGAALKTHEETGLWPEWVKHTVDTRNLFIPRPGKKMMTADLEQIEPRVLAWLAKDQVMLDALAKGDSPYVAHARATMKFTGVNMRDENPTGYALAKARVLSLGYQAGWRKFISMARQLAGLDVTKDDPEWVIELTPEGEEKKVSGYGTAAKKIVNDFRAQNKKVVDLWGVLDETFKRSIGSDFVMNLPSGRKMTYEKVRCEFRIEKDPETKKPKRKFVFTVDVGHKRVITYGGKLTENITQAIARDVFGLCVLALHRAGYRVLFTVHDEAVMELELHVTKEEIEETMGQPVPWLPGCKIAAAVSEVDRYCK